MIIEVNKSNFNEEVLKASKKVIVDFWATWCNPCKMMHPVLEDLDKDVGEAVKIAKINIDNDPELAAKYGVMSIPTFIIFENGNAIKSSVGMQSKENLKQLLNI